MTDKITIERETLEALESMLGDFCVSGRATDATRALSRKVAAALAAQPAEPVAAALDRMDQLFEPACGLLSISYGSATVQASRADMQIIRAALAAPPAPAAVPLTKEQRELFDLILHHYGPDKRLQPLRDLIAAAGDKP